MADYSPTIIAASLNDKELQESINKLVANVEEGTKKMSTAMTNAVEEMKKQLQSLGNINIDMGGSADGGSSRRKKKQEEETQAVKETTISYQNLEAAKQKAIGSSPAQDSYQEFVKNMRQNVALLAMEIKDMPNWSLDRQFGNYMQYERQIEQVRQRIQELKQELQNVGSDPNSSRLVIKQITEQIAQEQQKLVQLQKEQITTTKQIELADKQVLAQKQAQYETEKKALVDMSVGQRERISFGEKQIVQEAKITDEIRRQADEIRKSAEWKKYGTYQVYDRETNTTYQVAKSIELSLEEQILNIQKEKNKQIYQEEVEQQKQNSSLSETLNIERQITEEQGKRKKYISPTISTEMNAQSYLRFASERAGGQLLSYDELTSSSKRLGAALKQQQAIYASLTEEERQHPYGQTTLVNIQSLQRAISKLNSQMSRPISLEAAKLLPTKTLDDIAYKIQMLQRYRSGIDITKPNASKEIDSVNKAIAELTKKQRELLGTNKTLLESNNALARSWNYMKNRLAFYFTVGASTAFVKNLIEVRSQYEMNEKALGILINSAERGTQIFKELSEMALVSPYTLIELSSATKQLVAYGVAAKDAVDTTRRLADMAAAVGIPMERLTYALGQIKAYGYLNSRDNRMFANAGIPLVKQLADYYTQLEGKLVSVGDVYDRIKKKAVDYNDVMQVINRMTDEGGKFFNFQAKMADTLKVQLANLTLAWNNMLNDIGASNQGVISYGIKGLKNLFLEWKKIDSAITSAIGAGGLMIFVRALNVAFVKLGYQWRFLSKEMAAAGIAGAGAATRVATLGGTLVSLAKSSLTWWSLLAFAIVDVGKAIYYSNEAQETLNKSIREGARDNYKNVSDFLNEYQKLRNSLYKNTTDASGNSIVSTQDIDKSDARKAWEAMQEQIELTTRNSDEYISSLLRIENVSDRLRSGFSILDNIQEVSAALSQLDDNTIKVSSDWSKWWNGWTFPDGLISNLKDFVDVSQKYNRAVELFGKDDADLQYLKQQYEHELDALNKDIKKTTDSLLDFITLKGWQGDVNKINEVFSQAFNKIALDNSLTPQYAFELQLRAEEARSKAAKDAVRIRIEDEKAALKQAADEIARAEIKARLEALEQEYNDFEKWNGASRVYWQDFTKWMKEQHISEMSAMFRGMDAKQIASLNFEKGKYFEWVDELAKKYAKEHNMAYSDVFNTLRNYITSANQWSIFIPLTISTEDNKSIYETLTEADSAADTAYKKMKRLEERKKQLEKKGGGLSSDENVVKEYSKVTEELTNAQKDYNDALAKGGHSAKESKENAKERKASESELAKALKEELSLIDNVRSKYKKLTKEGVDAATALSTATSGFDETVSRINAVLGKYGIGQIDLTKYAGVSNPKAIMEMLQAQLDALSRSGLAKTSEIKDLQVKLQDLKVESLTFDQQTLTQSLNSELSKLKDEYELAVDLDANPELGSAFAETFGLDLSGMPKTIEDFIDRAQAIVDQKLGKAGLFDVLTGDVESLRETMGHTIDSNLIDAVGKAQKSVRDLWKKDAQDTISDWNKLLEKYAEYEYKRTQIIQEAEREREIARKKNAGDDILRAIDIREQRELAGLDFEQFQRSPEWIIATGDLATLTDKALGGLIKDLEEYKKKAKNLDPKQIKQLNDALKKLRNQQRQGNPFLAIKRAFEEAAEKGETANQKVKDLTERWMELKRKQSQSDEGVFLTKDEQKELDELPEKIDEAQKKANEAGKVSAQAMVAAINEMLQPINMVTGAIGDMFSAFGNTEASENIKKVSSMLDKAASFAAMGAQIGGGWGAAIGGVVGLLVGGISAFADEISGNASITRQVERSERAVRRLELAYIDLERAIEKAYGTEEYHAIKLAQANKQAQLLELKRQLQLEQSRSAKNEDKDKILDLQKQIKELENDINDSLENITNDFLGISGVSDAIEDMVGSMIDAFRNGEDAMASFEENIDEMIASMAKKLFSEKILNTWFKDVWNKVNSGIVERTAEYEKELAKLDSDFKYRSQTIGDEAWDAAMEVGGINEDKYNEIIADFLQNYYTKREYLLEQIAEGSKVSIDDLFEYADMLKSGYPIVQAQFEEFKEKLSQLLPIKDGVGDNLSALQQGIQGITEDTAGALEAMLNGISQQVYLHSSQLEEIKSIMQGWNFDVSLGTMSQVLLQLQSSYQVQMTIQNTLLGWSSPNGMSVRVEMV